MDLKTLSDEGLDALRVSVLAEQERRANLSGIPEQIEELARTFRDGGGSGAVLAEAIKGGGA